MTAENGLTGDKALDAALRELAGGAMYRVMSAGIRAGLGEIRKEIRKNVKPSVRKAIGSRFKKSKKFGVAAKVGGGVGKRRKAKEVAARARKGVGISANNVHWYLMGTKGRHNANGRYTGSMPRNDAVPRAFASASSTAMRKAKTKMLERLEKEAAKAAAKHRSKG